MQNNALNTILIINTFSQTRWKFSMQSKYLKSVIEKYFLSVYELRMRRADVLLDTELNIYGSSHQTGVYCRSRQIKNSYCAFLEQVWAPNLSQIEVLKVKQVQSLPAAWHLELFKRENLWMWTSPLKSFKPLESKFYKLFLFAACSQGSARQMLSRFWTFFFVYKT